MPAGLQAIDILNALPMPLLLIENGRVCYANAAFKGLGGWDGDLCGKSLADVFSAVNDSEGLLSTASGGKIQQFYQLVSIDAEYEPSSPPAMKVLPRKGIGEDFTGEHLQLMLLAPFTDHALRQAQNDFVSVISHEFRTPLTSIKGFADTMLRYGRQLGEEQQQQFILIIKEQADRLTRLVENLLTVSRLGAQKMELSFRAVDIRKILESVAQNLQMKGSQDKQYANRIFNIDIPLNLPGVWADPDKLEQVLINLADNAVKYSFPNTPIDFTVSIHASPEAGHDEEIDIAIANHGVGIPPESMSAVFNKFSRLDNPLTRSVEGTGLGLYITQALVAAIKGRISLESVPNEKTVFTVTLPMATLERQAMHRRQQFSEGITE